MWQGILLFAESISRFAQGQDRSRPAKKTQAIFPSDGLTSLTWIEVIGIAGLAILIVTERELDEVGGLADEVEDVVASCLLGRISAKLLVIFDP